MKITTFRDWRINKVVEGKREDYVLPSGTYEVERIKCPIEGMSSYWYVLKGTTIGAAVGWWRDWEDEDISSEFKIEFDFPREDIKNFIVVSKTSHFTSGSGRFFEENVFERIIFKEGTTIIDPEVAMEWSQCYGGILVKVVSFDFPILAKFSYVFSKTPSGVSVEGFIKILEDCGFKNVTERNL